MPCVTSAGRRSGGRLFHSRKEGEAAAAVGMAERAVPASDILSLSLSISSLSSLPPRHGELGIQKSSFQRAAAMLGGKTIKGAGGR